MVNVEDYHISIDKEREEYKNNFNSLFFFKQMELIEKYKKIEGIEDIFESVQTNVQTKRGQEILKDFFWRVTEELAEATEALHKEGEIHMKEEIADALHFIIEAGIIAGVSPKELKDVSHLSSNKERSFNELTFNVIYNLGLMGNTLKNKKWKQSQVETDEKAFKKYFVSSWNAFLDLCSFVFEDGEEVLLFYLKKHKVNEFRQKSKY